MERNQFSSDRRGFPRILSGYPVDIEIENPPSDFPASISGEVGNLSSEGASLILDSSLPVSSIVTLRLDLSPGSPQIETKVQVMWSYFLEKNKKFSCGVRFLDLNEKHREVLNELIGKGLENSKSVPERRKTERRAKTKDLQDRLWKVEMMLKKVKKTMERRVVITGLGVIAPNGIGKDAFWEAIVQGKSGIGAISRFDASTFPSKITGEIKDFNAEDYISRKRARRLDLFTQYGIVAAMMAKEDANLDIHVKNRNRIGVAVGSSMGGVPFGEHQHDIFREKGIDKVFPLLGIRVFAGSCSSEISIELGTKGHGTPISSGCATGVDNLGYAFESIRQGKADIIFAGASEAPLAPLTFGSLCLVRVMSTRKVEPQKALCPFDSKRDGIVLSEGVGVIVLEALDNALERGVHIYAEVLGYGTTWDGYHPTKPLPTGEQGVLAIRAALEECGLRDEEISCISAHGNSTPLNDRVETKIIKSVFGEFAYKIPITAIESTIGHPLGATGAIRAVASSLIIEKDIVPPTINYQDSDPECDLDYVPNGARHTKINTLMLNCFSFGGKNSILIFGKFKL